MRASVGEMTVDRAMKLVPIWKDKGIVVVEEMLGGRSNTSYRVQVDGHTYVLRVNAINGPVLGVDHESEHAILKQVSRAELGPEPVYIDQQKGVLVCDFIEGEICSTDDVRKPVNIRRIVSSLKKLHRLRKPRRKLDIEAVMNRYCQVIVDARLHYSEGLDALRTRLLGLAREWARGTEVTCLCHNDLIHSNIIDARGMQFIDWEYAATGDPMFELAALSQYHHYTERHTDYLLEQYFGETSSGTRHRMRKTQAVFDAVSILWVLAFRASAGGTVEPEAGSEGLLLEHLEHLSEGGSPLRGWG
jgi:thiamine kinase